MKIRRTGDLARLHIQPVGQMQVGFERCIHALQRQYLNWVQDQLFHQLVLQPCPNRALVSPAGGLKTFSDFKANLCSRCRRIFVEL
jgi:hypothetical protein